MFEYWNEIEFASKKAFLLFIPLLGIAVWYIYKYKAWGNKLHFSSTQFISKKKSLKTKLVNIPTILRLLGLSLLIIALARPQTSSDFENITSEGIDIVISMDISSSMLAQDFKPNRLEASKNVAKDFISERPTDRIGLVVFAGESFTQCPITTDHDVLKSLFSGVKSGIIEDGTAMGLGLGTSINRLKESEAKSKVIILLTDGSNNRGDLQPIDAAQIARQKGITVYTIGVGTNGMAPYPAKDRFGRYTTQQMKVDIDEKTLKEIAKVSGGSYFRATDNKSLAKIYKQIDKLEKTKYEVNQYSRKHEAFFPFALFGAALILIELLLNKTYFRRIS